MKKVAIIGAGVSGLSTAIGLRDDNYDVVVFDKSKGFSGRAASRSKHGVRYDHGANYFKTDVPEVEHLVMNELPREGLVDIGREVWVFDRYGAIQPGDPAQNAHPKWTYTDGISTLGKRMAAISGASFRRSSKVASLQRIGDQWGVICGNDDADGLFDAVVLTPPAPQSKDLLSQTSMDDKIRSRLVEALGHSHYHYQMSCVLAFDTPVQRPDNLFGLVNSDRRHPIAWLSFEEAKEGHVPEGKSVLVAQMAPDWSTQRIDESDTRIVESIIPLTRELLTVDLPSLSWFDLQRWRYAHPFSKADLDLLRKGERVGLFFAGDALVGKGRVARAMQTGFECARRIQNHLPS